jgi:hypothetical protein
MSKFTFICEDEPCPFGDSILAKRTVEFDATHLDGVIGEFETFLRGCGYHLRGYLEIVDEPLDKKYSKDPDDLDMYTESIFDKK